MMNNETWEKGTTKKLLKLLAVYMRPNLKLFAIGACLLPISVWTAVMIPVYIINLIDTVLPSGNEDVYFNEIQSLSLIVVIGIFSDGIFLYVMERGGLNTINDMRQALFKHCLKLKRKYFDKTPIGVLLTRITSDFEALGASLAIGMLNMLSDLLKGSFLIGLLFYINYELALVFILMLPVTFYVMKVIQNRLKGVYMITRVALAHATGYLQECLSGVRTIKLYSAENQVANKFYDKNRKFVKAQEKANIFETILFSYIDCFSLMAMGGLLWYGATQSFTGALTVGVLISFITTIQRIFVPIREFTQQITALQRSLSALKYIESIFDEPIEIRPTLPQPELGRGFKSLIFEDVSFRYGKDKPYVLENISFELFQGEKIAFVGTTGSGKSTIIRLVSKQYEDYEGSIKLNGVELSSMNHSEVANLVSIMQQDLFLFNETVDFNIQLERQSSENRSSEEAARYVHADKFIDELPEKYQFLIKGQGSNISSGERQLVAFARSVVNDNELFILDEATGSIDSITEEMIECAIDKILREKTVIAIAHRLSTIEKSDQIMVMNQGRIVERGSHKELMKHKGKYYRLVNE